MREGIGHDTTLAGGIALRGAADSVVDIIALRHEGAAAVVLNPHEQVARVLVGIVHRHAIGLGELVEQVRARQVLIAEHLGGSTMQEGGAIDAAIRAVAGGNGLLRSAVLAVNIPRRATECIALLGDEVRIAIHHEAVAHTFAVGIIAKGADACIIHQLRHLPQMVVGVCSGNRAIRVCRTQKHTASLFVAMRLDYASCIRGLLNRQ